MMFRTPTIVAVLCLGAGLLAQDSDRLVAKSELAERLDELTGRCASVGFTGAVLAAIDGKVLLARGVGHADLEGSKPNTANTLFELASVTKQFTAAAVCKLVEQGKLALDDSIAKHLPDIPEDCAAITVRHLLTHTSGIPGTNSAGGGDDVRKVIPVFLEGGPKHEPGTHWEYWNQGYALLAAIVERKSGGSYAEFCEKVLFAKAGMRTACFTGDAAPEGVTVAVGRSKRGRPRSALAHPYGSYGYQYRGMGGAVANVWDLWRWHEALLRTKVLGKASKQELFRPALHDYALGWFVKKANGRLVHYHGGGVRGFVCIVRRYPEQDACVFVLANDDRAPVHAVAALLEKALFGEKYALPPRTLDQESQADLTGTYEDAKGRRMTITADGAITRARLDWKRTGKGPTTRALIGASDGDSLVFFDFRSAERLGIERDGDDRVVTLRLGSMRFARKSK